MTAIPYPGLEQYLARLYGTAQAGTRVWVDAEGRAQGRYFNSTLTSAFQPIRELGSGRVVGVEGFARSYSDSDQGLSLWKLLDHAANDDESVELDRLCRMLHAINFFRQPEAAGSDLYLSVHARLLAAVDGNHGTAFSRILRLLGLPQQQVVLQLPAVVEHQGWVLNYVADNYRRNGFRIAANAADPSDALALVERVRPDVVKVDTRRMLHEGQAQRLLEICAAKNVRVIFKRLENAATLHTLRQVAAASGVILHAQGFLWDLPQASLAFRPRAEQPAFRPAPQALEIGAA
ncbi:MAG TPA: EAL domain-containing protein [Noviherbaspirillum sp.]|uniref:EAL domain-containing protein n=1 Tax=Noviherbaspirillum sp. TaxID=1926288 RepID=UPI002D3CAE7E|nr:EAL domain-containing protein [Noviherbaspirillum sp.]HYD97723.1 EAL domain-containing protein [Noviherbaspirillum sp.]